MLGFPRRLALHRSRVPALLRARVPGAPQGARGHGAHERPGHGSLRAHASTRAGASSSCSPGTGSQRGANGLKVIMMCELPTNAMLADALPRALRRHVDRLERHDAADARHRPRLRDHRPALRRARPRRQGAARDGDQGLQGRRQSTSGSAARVRPTTRTSHAGSSIKALTASRSNPDTVVETWLYLANAAEELGARRRRAGFLARSKTGHSLARDPARRRSARCRSSRRFQ